MILDCGEPERDFSKFMSIPSADEERKCYEAFYDATSNDSLLFLTCPICARKKLVREGDRSMLLSEPSVVEVLTGSTSRPEVKDVEKVVLRHLLQTDEGGISCWMCFDCIRALERHNLPKLSLANNLWVGEVPFELTGLSIPEQLLIARHYPRCYIFKLFPRDLDVHVPPDQLYAGMAGNASLFELNTQEVVEMLIGQRMPSPVRTLSSVIAITFVCGKKLPMDWLKKTFRVRRMVVYDALVWLKHHNPVYGDICIDDGRLKELPEDDVPEELLMVVRQEYDDEVAVNKRESYLTTELSCEDVEIENGMRVDNDDGK